MKNAKLLHCPFCALQVSKFVYAAGSESAYQCEGCLHIYKVDRFKVNEVHDANYEELELFTPDSIREVSLSGEAEVRRQDPRA